MTRTQWDIENEIGYCTKCGIEHNQANVFKRIERKAVNPTWCRDCRDDRTEIRRDYKWNHPVLGRISCWLWIHDLNDDWHPIDENGKLFRPGERLCGLKDCVRQTHIIEPVRKRRAKVSGKIKVESALAKELTPHNR
jgi:hypothetical protein